jgi:hypothetical protein
MGPRRAFIPVGRLVLYLVLLAVAGGAAIVAYTRMNNDDEPVAGLEVSIPAPAPAELSAFLADHHRAAAADKSVFQGKGAMGSATTDASQLSDCTAQWVGSRQTLEDLFGENAKAGPVFVGARKSAVPGPGPSAQLMFTTQAGAGPEGSASLYMKKYMQAPEQEDGNAQSLKAGGYDIIVWRKHGLVYDLVGPAAAVESLRKALGAPTPGKAYDGK